MLPTIFMQMMHNKKHLFIWRGSPAFVMYILSWIDHLEYQLSYRGNGLIDVNLMKTIFAWQMPGRENLRLDSCRHVTSRS